MQFTLDPGQIAAIKLGCPRGVMAGGNRFPPLLGNHGMCGITVLILATLHADAGIAIAKTVGENLIDDGVLKPVRRMSPFIVDRNLIRRRRPFIDGAFPAELMNAATPWSRCEA